MNLLKSLFLTLVTAVSVLAQPTIVNYRISTLPNSTTVAMISYSDGHVELTNTLPSSLTFSRKGGRLIRTYNPSGKRQWNISQFGQNQTYSPTFKLAIDFNPGGLSVAQRKALGINLFNFWSLSEGDKAGLLYGDGMLYLTESGLHRELEGAGYFECTLAEYEAKIWETMPACGYGADPGVKLLVFNIEQSNGWSKESYGGSSHWPSWESKKNKWIVLESQTGGMTLEQLANTPGLMQAEEAVRRANRRIIMHKVAKAKGKPGLLTSDGSSMYQGLPRMDFVNSNGIFLDGYADVSHIGGSNGTITLNGRTYTGVTGSHWAQEDVMDGYYYIFDKDMDASAYQATFISKVDSTQNYPYLWSKLLTRHITADEKGYIQLNRKRMIARQGQPRPILRQIEPQYEGDGMGLFSNGVYTGSYVNTRMTWNDLQPSATGDLEPPKMWQPPYYNYSRYIVTRFFAGNEAGWGLYVFPPANPNWVNKSLSETPIFNHHLHSLEAILQARADLQPYEQWFTGSTLVEDPEVQIGGVGSFTAYSGTEAYNYDAGVQGVQKPCYMMRFKAQTNGDIRVVVVGGMNQGWTDERVDIIRAPSSFTALAGNKFKVKLRGPSAQVCEFIVKSTDTGQTYEALFNANPSFEKPGYSGRVGVPTSGTSTPTVSTTTITIPAFSQTVPYSSAAKSDFLSASGDGSHHYNQFITSADWADYTITDAPVASNDYTLTFNYNTNYTCSGCGTGEYLINGGSPVSFPMDGASGGVRTVNFTGITLSKGTNTIRFRGTTQPSTYFQNYISVSRASSTSTISTTVTSSTTATPASYSKVFIVGNSISTNWTSGDQTKGLAASAPEKDYVHLLTAKLRTLNPSVDVRQYLSFNSSGPSCGGTALDAGDGPFWEQNYWSLRSSPVYCGFTGSDSLDRYNAVAAWQPDLIILRVAENVTNLSHNFEWHYKKLIDKLKSGNPSATIVLTTSAWQGLNSTQIQVSNIIKSVAAQRGYPIADLAGTTLSSNPADENHPGDTGMQQIADKIWAVIPKPSTACNFTVSTSNQSVSCGASFTLSSTASGTGASGLNYSWNRSGFSASGQQVAALAPSVSGAYSYTVTAGKLGCANKTAVATITVTGCSSNSLVALGLNPDFTAPADQGWNITTTREKYIENNTMKVGFLRGGAAVSYMALKSDNRNLINSHNVFYNDNPADFRYNTSTDDVGRQIMFFSDYMSPNPNDNSGQGLVLKNGKKTSTGYKGYVFNTGANTVQGGSLFPALDFSPILSSAVYTHPTRGTEFYAKMRPMIWGVGGETGWVTGEQWCWFAAPNVLAFFARHTVEVRDPARFDEQRTFEAQNQENPSIYTIAPLTQILIDIPGQSRKNIYQQDATSQKYYTTTARIGAYEGNGGKGVTYYSPMNSQVGAMASTAGTGSPTGGWADDPFSYISGAPNVNYDNPGIYEDYGYIILGTEAEANAAIASLPGIDQSFDFDFSKENMRWYNGNSRLIKEAAGWTLYLDPHTDNGVTSYLAKMMAPARAWQASGFTKINLEIACTNTTSLRLEYQKPGLTYENQYSTVFPVQGDGQFHTYSINVSDLGSNFSGIISSIGFSAGPGTQPNAKVVVKRIWKN